MHNKTKFEHTKELFKSANVLNLHQLNIFSISVFMNKVHAKTSLPVFTGSFQRISHLNSTRSSTFNFSKPKLKLAKIKCRISIRSTAIWNDIDEDCLKSTEKSPFLKDKMKSKLLILIMR